MYVECELHHPPVDPGQKMDPDSIVETADYIPQDVRIKQFLNAGKQLRTMRADAGTYDFQPNQDDDDEFYDPTRDPNFDMADASGIALDVQQKYNAAVKKFEAETASNGGKQEVPTTTGGVPTPSDLNPKG